MLAAVTAHVEKGQSNEGMLHEMLPRLQAIAAELYIHVDR